MDEEDFLAIIMALEDQLLAIGAAELIDPRHYSDFEAGSVPSGKTRLLRMLSAFDRYLAIEDRRTYEKAMSRIGDAVREGHVQGAVVVLPDRERTIDLASAPDLNELRALLTALISSLHDVGPGSVTEGSAQ